MISFKKLIFIFALVSTTTSCIFPMNPSQFSTKLNDLDLRLKSLQKRMKQLYIAEKNLPCLSFENFSVGLSFENISEDHFQFKALINNIKMFIAFELEGRDLKESIWAENYTQVLKLLKTKNITTKNYSTKVYFTLTSLVNIFNIIKDYYVENDNSSKKFFFHIQAAQGVIDNLQKTYKHLFRKIFQKDILENIKKIFLCNKNSVKNIKIKLLLFINQYKHFAKLNPNNNVLSNNLLKEATKFSYTDKTKRIKTSVLKKTIRNLLFQLNTILKKEYQKKYQKKYPNNIEYQKVKIKLIQLINSIK